MKVQLLWEHLKETQEAVKRVFCNDLERFVSELESRMAIVQ